jgi:hypothetical protein
VQRFRGRLPSRRALPAAVALGFFALTPARCAGQTFDVAPVVGVMQFDAGGDAAYFTWGIQLRYFITPSFRVGLTGSSTHIGDPPRQWAAPGTDQQFWRVGAMAEFATHPYHKASFSIRALLGFNTSSGLIYQGPPPGLEPFWGITDSPSGVSYGGGLGLEVGPFSQVRFLVQGNIWMDNAYGASGFDPELLFGLGVDL